MIYLCVNLPAYRQLSKLRKEVLQSALDAVADFARAAGCELVFDDDGTWICTAAFKGSNAEIDRRKREFAASVLDLKTKMSEYARRLQGYFLFIDEAEGNLGRSLLGELKSRMFDGANDGELVITANAVGILDGLFEVAGEQGETWRVLGAASAGKASGPQSADFLVRQGLLSDLTRMLESMRLGEIDERTLIVLAEPGDGGIQTVEYALDVMFSGTDVSWIATRGGDSRFGDAYPVTRGVVETMGFCPLPEYLRNAERQLWDQQVCMHLDEAGGRNRRLVSDRAGVDIFKIIALQLTAYERWMAGQLVPPTWLCESYEQLAPSVKEACLRAVRTMQTTNLITIFVVHDQAVPRELGPVPHLVLEVPKIGKQEMVSKLASFPSGETALQYDAAAELWMRFIDSGGGSITRLYHLYCLSKRRDVSAKELREPLCALLSALDTETQKALLLMIEAELVLPEKQLAEFLAQCDIDPEALRSAGTAERNLKLCIANNPIDAAVAVDCLQKIAGVQIDPLLRKLAGFLTSDDRKDTALISSPAMDLLRAAGEPGLSAGLVQNHVESLIESADLAAAAGVLEKAAFLRKDPTAAVTMQILRLKVSVIGSSSREAALDIVELRKLPDTGNDMVEGQRNLEYARYHYATHSFQEGLQDAKNSLLRFQNHNVPQECEAYFFIGLHMLAQSRVDEAEAYLQIARESTSRQHAAIFILNGAYSALTQFMIGNLTRALAALTETRKLADECALHGYQVYLIFVEVRIQFELGRYERCVDLCLEGLTGCQLYGDGPRDVFEKWLRRAEGYCGSPAEAAKALMKYETDAEARFFLAEALYLAEQQEKALQNMESVETDLKGASRLFAPAEQPIWETGFSNFEDRAIHAPEDGGVLSVMMRAFHAYLQSAVAKDETGVNVLARITREEKLSNIDPYNGMYYYLYACAIGAIFGEKNLDRLTALSKAFKYVQERAATMDDSHDKQSYLHKNYFNSRILREARESNLM
ncbi:MAG: hypothetical protein JW852_08100 [Spirochaetales bacterium]|nr:hypothetical protein [Spirochaetales bacterium]